MDPTSNNLVLSDKSFMENYQLCVYFLFILRNISRILWRILEVSHGWERKIFKLEAVFPANSRLEFWYMYKSLYKYSGRFWVFPTYVFKYWSRLLCGYQPLGPGLLRWLSPIVSFWTEVTSWSDTWSVLLRKMRRQRLYGKPVAESQIIMLAIPQSLYVPGLTQKYLDKTGTLSYVLDAAPKVTVFYFQKSKLWIYHVSNLCRTG